MTPLQKLARRCGIALSWSAPHGVHRVSPETLRKILAALGIEAETDERAVEALAALERQAWQSIVRPVVVARESAVAVDVMLPEATRLVSWQLIGEDGAQRAGEVAFGDLALVSRDEGDVRPGQRKECRRLPLGRVPLGYHRLSVEPQSGIGTVIVTPGQCFLPDNAAERGVWGLALQLYLLKSERNFGIGDFGDLASLATQLASRGCDVIGLNPLHAPFPDDPEHASPYSPASRLLLNALNIDVAAAPEARASPAAAKLLADLEVRAEVAKLRAADVLEYSQVAALKERILRAAFADWRAAGGDSASEFVAFRAERGATFERHCLYLALRAHVLAEHGGGGDWRNWPEAYRDSRGRAVAEFARTHAEQVTWVAWQQWLADRQLAAAAAAGRSMRIGLYRDLAVGADAAGAESWAEPDLMAQGLHIGAPPDALSAAGQEWGLPPPHPERIRDAGYRSFVQLLRANMRHAGALRIDHVMALERLYVIPKGDPASEGAYLDYPFADLAGIVALESVRNRCVVIGEDLGSVPQGFRERMAEARMLSYRVLRFEREGQRFLGPQEYPRLALAVFGNHDMPTLRGWWEGADVELGHEQGVLSPGDLAAAQWDRDAERRALLDLLRSEGLIAAGEQLSYDTLCRAVHALLGRTRALMVLAQLDDVLRERAPVNMPALQKYPSWRRRYSQSVERLADEPLLEAVAAAFDAPRSSVA